MIYRREQPKDGPLTFDLKQELYEVLLTVNQQCRHASLSDTIRLALETYDFDGLPLRDKRHKQLSVRLPLGLKKRLFEIANDKGVSIGELLRNAIEGLAEAVRQQTVHRQSKSQP